MGNKQYKQEDIVIAQNASGGSNTASAAEDLKFHAGTTNILLLVIVTLMALGGVYGVYRLYKKTHKKWMRREITLNEFRRSFRLRPKVGQVAAPGLPPNIEEV